MISKFQRKLNCCINVTKIHNIIIFYYVMLKMQIISGERLQSLAEIAILDDGNPNNNIYSHCQYNVNCDNLKEKINIFLNAKIIYVKTDYLGIFKTKILPFLKQQFLLITHNSDRQIPSDHQDILNHPNLIRWYGQNVGIRHEKLLAIPIGIANSQWPHGKIELLEEVMTNINSKLKTQLVYVNFSVNTNKSVREKVKKILINNGFTFTNPNLQWKDYLVELSKYKFAVCPEGNGFDCHRLWECLYLGVIPIVKNIIAFEQFKDLPILFVEDWEAITVDYLDAQYETMTNKQYCLSKLDLEYWRNCFKEQL